MYSRHHCSIVKSLLLAGGLVAILPLAAPLNAQDAPAVAPTAAPNVSPNQLALTDALSTIQPLLAQVNQATSSIDVHRWKAPGDVRDTTASDIQSIQKDINQTLPTLIQSAQNSPGAIAPAFAVFRNIDALYDVLLRVTETATLAGAQNEAQRLEEVRSQLQSRRGQLGNAILNSASAQDSDVVRLRTAAQAAATHAATTQAAAPNKVIVNDGPATSAKSAKRKKSTTTPPPAPAAHQ